MNLSVMFIDSTIHQTNQGVADSAAFQVGDHSTTDTHQLNRCNRKVVVPRSRRSPHFVVLQQVRINEHTQLGAVTEGGNAVIGLGNLSRNAQTSLDIF